MRTCLFEDAGVSNLQPLTLTRPAFDLRCGAVSLRERQERCLPERITAALVRPELAEMCRHHHPHLQVNDPSWLADAAGTEAVLLVNARWLAPASRLTFSGSFEVGTIGDQPAYVVAPAADVNGLSLDNLSWRLAEWQRTLAQRPAGGHLIDYPWHLVEHNAAALAEDFEPCRAAGLPHKPEAPARGLFLRTQARSASEGITLPVPSLALRACVVSGPAELVLAAPTAHIEPLVLIDTTRGPVLIDDGAIVQAFSRVEGPCYIGAGTHLLGARVRGSSIGPHCRIGGEVEASIVHGFSNKAHDGFLGHSYLGEWVNFGAGTQTSDLRTDYGPVRMIVNGRAVETGLLKVGSFVGDHTTTSLNTLFNTGTLAGAFGQLLTSEELLPRVVPSFCRYGRGRLQERSSLREAFATAATMMARRGRQWTETHAELFFTLFEQTAAERRQLLRESEQGRRRRVV